MHSVTREDQLYLHEVVVMCGKVAFVWSSVQIEGECAYREIIFSDITQ